MTPEEVRTSLGSPFKCFKRTPQSVHSCDHFPCISAFAYYTADGKSEAFEFAKPALLTFEGKELLGGELQQIVEYLSIEDPAIIVMSDGFRSLHLGFGAIAIADDGGEDDEGQKYLESVIVFSTGYYD